MQLGSGSLQMNGARAPAVVAASTDPQPSYSRVSTGLIADDATYIAFPGVVRLGDDSLLVLVRSGTAHVGGGNIVKYAGNSTGSSWSGPTTVLDNAKDIRDVELMRLSGGDIICTYTECTSVATADFVPKCIKSTDSGATWGSPVTIAHGFSGWGFITAKLIELANGDLLAPMYGVSSGGESGFDDYCRLSKSTDDAATWSPFSTIVAEHTSGLAWTEPNLFLKANGDLVCAIRSEPTQDCYLSTSSDDGATWSAQSFVRDGGGRPSIIETADDALMVALREPNAPTDPVVHWTFNGGATWANRNLGATQPFVYGSWVVLASGDIGLVWCVEEGSDADANIHFDVFEYVEL